MLAVSTCTQLSLLQSELPTPDYELTSTTCSGTATLEGMQELVRAFDADRSQLYLQVAEHVRLNLFITGVRPAADVLTVLPPLLLLISLILCRKLKFEGCKSAVASQRVMRSWPSSSWLDLISSGSKVSNSWKS
jgi:hypothetical protein